MLIDILGDICLAWSSLDSQTLEAMTKLINNQLGNVDYRIANLEAPVIKREDLEPAPKEGIRANLRMMQNRHQGFIKNIDINGYTLANNHLGDYGVGGIEDTLSFLEEIKRDYVGTSLFVADTYIPLRIEVDNIKLSIFSFCENEFGIVRNDRIGAAGFEEQIVKNNVMEERKKADKIIVIFHGGTEHYPLPTPKQQSRYRWLIDIGVDAVIGMHSHCPVGMEKYNQGIIYYGVGNFYFPRNNPIVYSNWYYGYVVRLNIRKDETIFSEILPYKFDYDGVKWELINVEYFKQYFNNISLPIKETNEIKIFFNGWVQYNGKYLYDALKQSLLKDDDMYCSNIAKNLLSCEAHNELLCTYLNNKYYEPNVDYIRQVMEIKEMINCNCEREIKIQEVADIGESADVQNIVLWGITNKTIEKLKQYNESNIRNIFLVDSDERKQGFMLLGKKINSPEYVINNIDNAYFYVGTTQPTFEIIKEYLKRNGIRTERVSII